jgi:hypothetical protein
MAAMFILCCGALFNARVAKAQSCFCIDQLSTCNNCNLNCDPIVAGTCTVAQCTDCRYIGIRPSDGCCFTQLTLTSNECFNPCAILRTPIADHQWTTLNNGPGGSSTSCDLNSKTIYDQTGLWPLCGSAGCICPNCSGPFIIVKVCGTFPMTITVTAIDCNNQPCSQNITVS